MGGTLEAAAAASAMAAVVAVTDGWGTCDGSGAKSDSAACADMGVRTSRVNNPRIGNFVAVERIFRIIRVKS
jgi:hypothetical protein